MVGPSLWVSTAEEAERLRLFIGSVTDYAIYMLSPEGHVVSWNAGAQRFKGYTADEIIGQHFSRFYTAEDQYTRLPWRALRIAEETGKFEAEGWRVRKDGTHFWASVVIDPIRDATGRLLGFAKITRDITDRKLMQDALRQSEERFRLLVQGVTDYAIYMLSPSGEITNWNEGGRRIKGYEQDEVVGSHFSRFYTEEDQAAGKPATALAQAREHGRFEAEGWRMRKDGSRFWAHVIIDAIRDDAGELVGFAKITRDITERRNTEAALASAREALFQSQKLEAIGKLTGGVAHDFNNLLSVVGNGVALLRERLKEPADLRVLDSVDQATRRGAALTQQLLSFARQQPLRSEPRDLNRLITHFEPVLRRGSRSAVQFDLRLQPGVPLAMLDGTQFETALLNLVVNARDATPDGGQIVVGTGTVDLGPSEVGQLPPGRYASVCVQDTGTGMSAEVIERAVEPFFTTKEVGKGTGLGLSQVYGLTQQSGGDLKIVSEPGRGTTITMYFPGLAEDTVEAQDTEGAEKVLLVDDQPDVLEMAAELFRTLGFEVLVARSGTEAFEVLQRTPDLRLLVTDVVMPGMTGIQLGQRARQIRPDLKIILVSGYPKPALQDSGDLHGFEFLSKPYRIADLVKKLRALA
ncbi:hybrid sensor histidine kinase/response regulator [Ramlibacter aurantiacus]|uniref:hybrid sensor histidine kinase/response regulator n=1 Tax=Ramlibacter aurantiacus TaxID=2801330 RepID=UPI00338F1234